MRKLKKNFINIKLVIIIIFIFLIILVKPINKSIFLLFKKEEIISNIEYEIYSNENNILKFLVKITDTENGIKEVIYPNKDKLICNGKTDIEIDYVIKDDGKYTFIAETTTGRKIEKTIEVNEEFRKNKIIFIEKVREDRAEKDYKLDYNYKNIEFNCYYAIGKDNQQWISANNGIINIKGYDVLNKNLLNEDGTMTLKLNKEDQFGNKVEVEYIDTIMTKAPSVPKIIVKYDKSKIDTTVLEYPVITTNGMMNCSVNPEIGSIMNIEIKGTEEGVINYYSLDEGKTWNEYIEPIKTKYKGERIIQAKSINSIGLESGINILRNYTFDINVNCTAKDALDIRAYDGDYETSYPSRSEKRIFRMIGDTDIFQINFVVDRSDTVYYMIGGVDFAMSANRNEGKFWNLTENWHATYWYDRGLGKQFWDNKIKLEDITVKEIFYDGGY